MITPRILLLAACFSILAGCATPVPRGPVGHFSVKVVPFFGRDVKVYYTSYERNADGTRGSNLSGGRVTGDGVVGFVLPAYATYGVRAYADMDGDGRRGATEPTASVEGLKPSTDIQSEEAPVVLTMPGTGIAPEWPSKKTASNPSQNPLDSATIQKGMDKLREAAPDLPIPPLPIPPPP